MPDGGRLTISSACCVRVTRGDGEVERPPGVYARICVSDRGCGIDAETLKRVFEPFFTTKSVGRGSGLGLSTVYGFAQQSGGSVEIDSTPAEGTRVSLYLPTVQEEIAEPGPAELKLETAEGLGGLVLLVDDDSEVRAVVRRQLSELGYVLIEAPSGDQALELLANIPEISILLSDVVMPGSLDGYALAEQARALRPDLTILLMTAYNSGQASTREQSFNFPVLSKPFDKQELRQALKDSSLPTGID